MDDTAAPRRFEPMLSRQTRENHIIAIGASTGGTTALVAILEKLPVDIPGVVVVQHMTPGLTATFAARLNTLLPFDVSVAVPDERILPGHVYLAPGERNLTIKRIGDKYFTRTDDTRRINGHCPSVDALFESVAHEAGRDATGIILTGMGADGAAGLLEMRRAGAFTIGQDKATSVVYGMPAKAYECGAVMRQIPIEEIASAVLVRLIARSAIDS